MACLCEDVAIDLPPFELLVFLAIILKSKQSLYVWFTQTLVQNCRQTFHNYLLYNLSPVGCFTAFHLYS